MLIDNKKVYSKEEFIKLNESELGFLIGSYTLKNNEQYEDYYVMCYYKDGKYVYATKELEEFVLDEYGDVKDGIGVFSLIKIEELSKIENEAFDRLFFTRHGYQDNIKDKEVKKENIKNSDRIIREYENVEKMNDFEYGYWSGILALCRYLTSTYYSKEELVNKDKRGEILSL